MAVPRLSPYRLAYLLVVPLFWAVLLMFHPAPDIDDIYGSLRNQATLWLVVHFGTLLFIGLMGGAVMLLVSDLPGQRRSAGLLPSHTCCATAPQKRSSESPLASLFGTPTSLRRTSGQELRQRLKDSGMACWPMT